MGERETRSFVRAGRGAAAALAALGLSLVARAASADPPDRLRSDPERRCRTIRAFEFDATPQGLKEALARAGSAGRTRLDLDLDMLPAVPADATDDPHQKRLPRWTKPLDAARTIAAAKTMAGVKELLLDRFPMTVKAAAALAASPHLGALESLSLSNAQVTGPVLHELLAPGALPGLVELDVTNNRMKAADLEELAARLAGRKIRRLLIGAQRTGLPDVATKGLPHDPAAIAALAHIAAVPGLAVLDLNDERIGLSDLETLLKVARTQPLEIDLMAFPKLDAKQMAALAALDPEGHITFAVSEMEKAATLRALDKSGLLARFTLLEVSCGDACARVIAGSKNVGRLRKLVFWCDAGVSFTKASAVALSRAAGLSGLRDLSFCGDGELCEGFDGIGAEGLRALLAAPFVGQLERLRLENQELAGAAVVGLARATSLGALKELQVVEEHPILTAANAGVFFRDGALARQLEVLRLQNESDDSWPIAELARGVKMPKLRVLELPSARGALREWLKAARAPGWRQVRVFSIYAKIDDGEQSPDPFSKELRAHMAPDACVISP